VAGKIKEPKMEISGYLKENPDLKIFIQLTRRAELP
jgi:hypothetical protein